MLAKLFSMVILAIGASREGERGPRRCRGSPQTATPTDARVCLPAPPSVAFAGAARADAEFFSDADSAYVPGIRRLRSAMM